MSVPNGRLIMNALISVNSEEWGSKSLFETHNSLGSKNIQYLTQLEQFIILQPTL